jgi:hypothetical protein
MSAAATTVTPPQVTKNATRASRRLHPPRARRLNEQPRRERPASACPFRKSRTCATSLGTRNDGIAAQHAGGGRDELRAEVVAASGPPPRRRSHRELVMPGASGAPARAAREPARDEHEERWRPPRPTDAAPRLGSATPHEQRAATAEETQGEQVDRRPSVPSA